MQPTPHAFPDVNQEQREHVENNKVDNTNNHPVDMVQPKVQETSPLNRMDEVKLHLRKLKLLRIWMK